VIVGVGVDVVGVERFAKTLERTPGVRDRLFTAAERELPVESLAVRFAAKEALAKALGAPAGLRWHDAEVPPSHASRPVVGLRGTVARAAQDLGVTSVHLSLSHDAGIAMAFVVAEG
jgi:holo-[acyl-carrier protein] synthase